MTYHTASKITPAILLALSMLLIGGCATSYHFETDDDRSRLEKGYVPPHGNVCALDPVLYGYNATCWNGWPAGWTGCPPCGTEAGQVTVMDGEAAGPSEMMLPSPRNFERFEPTPIEDGDPFFEEVPQPPPPIKPGLQPETSYLPMREGETARSHNVDWLIYFNSDQKDGLQLSPSIERETQGQDWAYVDEPAGNALAEDNALADAKVVLNKKVDDTWPTPEELQPTLPGDVRNQSPSSDNDGWVFCSDEDDTAPLPDQVDQDKLSVSEGGKTADDSAA